MVWVANCWTRSPRPLTAGFESRSREPAVRRPSDPPASLVSPPLPDRLPRSPGQGRRRRPRPLEASPWVLEGPRVVRSLHVSRSPRVSRPALRIRVQVSVFVVRSAQRLRSAAAEGGRLQRTVRSEGTWDELKPHHRASVPIPLHRAMPPAMGPRTRDSGRAFRVSIDGPRRLRRWPSGRRP